MKHGTKKKELHVSQEVKYSDATDTYIVQLKKRRRLWWLLLLLLPLLLLIKCERSLTVYCYDIDTHEPVEGAKVKLSYSYHYLFDDTGLFMKYDEVKKGVTDKEGLAKFDNIKCSLFCYLFHLNAEASVIAESGCYDEADTTLAYHRRKRLELPMRQKTGLPICVVDEVTQMGIPGAIVRWRSGGALMDSIQVDADGRGVLPNVPICYGLIDRVEASAVDYYDTVYRDVLITVSDNDCLPIYMRHEVLLMPCDEIMAYGSNRPETLYVNLGQRTGSFILEYATGELYPDSIVVHDGIKRTDPVIFQFAGLTGVGWDHRQSSRPIRFTKPNIMIEVFPSEDSSTWWKLKVNCP